MGPSFWQLLIVLVIVLLLFGTKKLRNIGGDLGSAIKSFRSAVKNEGKGEQSDEDEEAAKLEQEEASEPVMDTKATSKERDSA